MACGNDARLTLTTYCPLPANRFVSPIEAVRPRGLRPCPRSDAFFRVGLVTTAVQLTFISLISRAEPEFLGTVPWLTDPTTVIYILRLHNANHTSIRSTAGVAIAHLPCLRCRSLYRLFCAPEVRPLWLPAVDDEEER
jgi:hypothetical protein